jgi:hypothetical protein
LGSLREGRRRLGIVGGASDARALCAKLGVAFGHLEIQLYVRLCTFYVEGGSLDDGTSKHDRGFLGTRHVWQLFLDLLSSTDRLHHDMFGSLNIFVNEGQMYMCVSYLNLRRVPLLTELPHISRKTRPYRKYPNLMKAAFRAMRMLRG